MRLQSFPARKHHTDQASNLGQVQSCRKGLAGLHGSERSLRNHLPPQGSVEAQNSAMVQGMEVAQSLAMVQGWAAQSGWELGSEEMTSRENLCLVCKCELQASGLQGLRAT